MAKPQISDAIRDPAPDFLTHLEQTFGWSEARAIDALGAFILSSKAGRALNRELVVVESAISSTTGTRYLRMNCPVPEEIWSVRRVRCNRAGPST